jgi:hypothetical protein
MRKWLGTIAALLAFMPQPVSAQTGASAALDDLIRSYGLDNLNDEQMAAARRLVAAAIGVRRNGSELGTSAQAYVKRQGFEICEVSLVSLQAQRWLVVKSGFQTKATKDIPFLFSTIGFRDGSYFCKPGILGGLRELLDDRGEVQTFLFANWIDLR